VHLLQRHATPMAIMRRSTKKGSTYFYKRDDEWFILQSHKKIKKMLIILSRLKSGINNSVYFEKVLRYIFYEVNLEGSSSIVVYIYVL
jgi:hypothetical protein